MSERKGYTFIGWDKDLKNVQADTVFTAQYNLIEYKNNTIITIENSLNEHILYIEMIGYFGNDYARVIIQDSHTHVYLIEKSPKLWGFFTI